MLLDFNVYFYCAGSGDPAQRGLMQRVMRKKKKEIMKGDIFIIQLNDNSVTVGQFLDNRYPNTARIALFNERFKFNEKLEIDNLCNLKNLISLVECTLEQLKYGVWEVIGNKKNEIDPSRYPNEEFRKNNWIGSQVSDAGLIEDFVNAFYGLIFWDDWFDPNYLDKFLLDSSKKPSNLLIKNR